MRSIIRWQLKILLMYSRRSISTPIYFNFESSINFIFSAIHT
jgi:hypothetical protein